MKRFFALFLLCALMVAGVTSCKKQGGEVLPAASQKGTVRVEKFEGIERGSGLSGDVLLSVSNGLRSDITLTSGEIWVNFGGKRVVALQLTGEVTLPKKVISSVRVPVSLNISSPIVAYALATKVVRGDFDKMSLTIDAKAKIGAARRHIYKENIPVQEAFKMVGIPTDGLKGLINQ